MLALDPEFVVIGGGLMDPENTTDAFRERYLIIVRETARPHLWPVQRDRLTVVAVDAGRAVAGDRRRAGRAVPQPALTVPNVTGKTPRARRRRTGA